MSVIDVAQLPPAEFDVDIGRDPDERRVVVCRIAFGGDGPVKRDDGLWQAAIVLLPLEMRRVAFEMIRQADRAEGLVR